MSKLNDIIKEEVRNLIKKRPVKEIATPKDDFNDRLNAATAHMSPLSAMLFKHISQINQADAERYRQNNPKDEPSTSQPKFDYGAASPKPPKPPEPPVKEAENERDTHGNIVKGSRSRMPGPKRDAEGNMIYGPDVTNLKPGVIDQDLAFLKAKLAAKRGGQTELPLGERTFTGTTPPKIAPSDSEFARTLPKVRPTDVHLNVVATTPGTEVQDRIEGGVRDILLNKMGKNMKESKLTESFKNIVKNEFKQMLKEAEEKSGTVESKLETLRKKLIKEGQITPREMGSGTNNRAAMPERRIPLYTVSKLIDVPMNELILYFLNGERITEGEDDQTRGFRYGMGHVYFYDKSWIGE